MTDITFITSNPTKVAHARHLCKEFDINILQYKKFFYGKGYIEPRIYEREELLEASINDAKKRWEKNVSDSGNRLFFIEDTSVRIDALSDEKTEIPGVDIKYWMQENDFSKLDAILKEKGNNRDVSVSSHLVLFLTNELKRAIGASKDFIIFSSSSHGKIVSEEKKIDTQILYPWLDNVTFNKWFVPDGYDLPISLLNISDADRADFRKGAFEQMLDFLTKHDSINNIHQDVISPKLRFDPLYLVCGPTCAGKSTIGKFLLEKYGYYHIEASDFMSLRYFETHSTKFYIDKNIFAAELLKTDPIIVVKSVLEYIRKNRKIDNFVVTGFRTPKEIEWFNKSYSPSDTRMVYIDADYSIRFVRWLNRQRDSIAYTKDRFSQLNQLQDIMGLVEVKKMTTIIQYDNSQDGLSPFLKDFQQEIIKAEPIINKNELADLKKIQKIQLEKAILLVLALKYQENESSYYTTTEISYHINETFQEFEKNKNNISRYFNQSFYPYYEIKKEKGKNKYKLSPTGYSEAIFLIRHLKS
jgi:inosine/xanthosine triphosphate pyrophosphatase family protein/adenylate kinase family enzyme